MKTSIWDILTGVVLIGILCLVAGFSFLLLNPSLTSGAQMTIPTISLPTATATVPGLPPTWTPAAVEAQATATFRPTGTLPPTNTPVVLPTFTASPRPRSSGGGSGNPNSGGNCSVTFQQPADDSYQDQGYSFPMRWTLKNTSSKTWRSDSVDVRFVSGDRMGASDKDLQMDVSPDGMVDIIVNMVTPYASGKVASNWGLFEGSTSLCRFFVEFNVK